MPVIVKCIWCKQSILVSCTQEQLDEWRKGNRLIQDVMPNVPKGERELLISGTCDACFDRMARTEEE